MITVLAATGFTGQLVAREVKRLGLPLRLAGRSAEKLSRFAAELGHGVETVVADVKQPETLLPIFEGTGVLINCAGPFTELGEPVVAAAVHHGVHYLDTTGEQAFIKLVFERYSELAKQKGIVVAPATAFEYALSDAAAALAARELEPCDEISIVYAVSGFGASRGTKKSVLRVLTDQGYLYQNGELVPTAPGREQRTVHLPSGRKLTAVSFPGGEAILVPRHVRTQAVIPMMALEATTTALLGIGLPLLRAAMKTPMQRWLLGRIEAGAVGPTDEERKNSRFTVVCEASRGEDRHAVIVQGRDPYGLTATIAVAAASHLLRHGAAETGALSPAMIAGPELIVESTRAAGVTWLG
ncbi:MAG: saccharopine dehydrogenase NADP-binding domain-containing protein [Acidobacteriota bacterium]|nr:saccharopine dehydrogenase NADP-binding domain-containing protein [Blastocatellia bacterium]MDW8239314.1 saccharopine dehydrogenase NADP-binding domain-containing protein [Acidobacteriota bacterium]